MTNPAQEQRLEPGGHVVVVGAGIVGVATAIWLQRDGYRVTLIDRGAPGDGTSYGNAGVLASCSIVPVTTPGLWKKVPGMLMDPNGPLSLRWGYLPRMLPWLAAYMRNCHPERVAKTAAAMTELVSGSLEEHQSLSNGTDAARHVVPCDYVFAYADRSAYESDAFGWSLRRKHGFDWEEMAGAAFHAYDASMEGVADFGVRCGDHGRITDPGQYVKDLARHFEAEGGTVRQVSVRDFTRDDHGMTGVVTDDGELACDRLVLTAGVWSKELSAKLGIKTPLESERGYHVELFEPSFTPRAPTMVASGKFVLTPMEGRLRVAGLVEFGGLDAPPNPARHEMLLRSVRRAFPKLTFGETKSWMGHRPAPPDSIPYLGAVRSLRGAFVGFGHHHVGLTSGPRTGRVLANLIAGRTPNFDLAPYAPERFS